MLSCGWRVRPGWRLAAAALLVLAASSLRVPRRSALAGRVPRAPPHALAEHLADFNNLRAFYPHIESWRIEEQWNNYTSWRYVVRFACGARCAGRGAVTAHDEYAPSGGQAPAAPRHGLTAHKHRVLLELSTCWTPPLLPWPTFCDDRSVESVVSSDGAGGAQLSEAASASTGLAAWLAGRGAALSTERHQHLQSLQAAFA